MRRGRVAAAFVALATGLTASLVAPSSASAEVSYGETTGGVANTWTNYTNAGGIEGTQIGSNVTVGISCVLTGFAVADGNTAWYRIASAPWSDAYYVSADAFYNNGATSGSLAGTPFVDPAVPNCASVPAPSPQVTLAQGPPAPAGYRYAIAIANFAPNSSVSVSCFDSVSPSGFYTFSLTTNASGSASTASYCYSGDGPDHWVVAGGVESNHVSWGTTPVSGTGSSGGSGTGGGGGGTGGGVSAPFSCAGAQDSGQYDGWGACEWAVQNVSTAPRFYNDDCTWFVSQALWQGDLKKTSKWTSASWNYADLAIKNPGSPNGPFALPGPTVDSADAPNLVAYLVAHHLATKTKISWSDNTAGGAKIGDLIAYYWNRGQPTGTIDHLAIVTGFSGSYPLVSQHTSSRLNRGWSWNPDANGGKGNWIQYSSDIPNPIAYLIHITG